MLYENHDCDMACLLYGIREVRMCHEVGNLAIFKNKMKPELIFAHSSMMYPPNGVFFDTITNNKFIFCKVYISSIQSIFILNILKSKFSFYDVDTPNPCYNIKQNITGDLYFEVDEYQAINDTKLDKMKNLTIALNSLEWLGFDQLIQFCETRYENLIKKHYPTQYAYNLRNNIKPNVKLIY